MCFFRWLFFGWYVYGMNEWKLLVWFCMLCWDVVGFVDQFDEFGLVGVMMCVC